MTGALTALVLGLMAIMFGTAILIAAVVVAAGLTSTMWLTTKIRAFLEERIAGIIG